ncbi:cell division protein ZapA [Novosphingobium album (ex Liu et al. 2023)]|uniref:Cell division protein ZapA n=1 Tax=Novosphingobium album (ex Liu et al. 2023) TaxID=3031130 RepID=A0ABT5WTK0_9SPHN|nr:cell division protein ZapA [Novosphingobium album (ex Liu et al. 2023)]MDE8653219.1 cell division protein ZapA [Novosphingobium album (ex Liu et al. 2023)]
MSNVSLVIGGRGFTVACADGEEAHIASLGRMIDARLEAAGGVSGQSEPRMLLFAALLLADELYELRQQPVPAPASIPPGLDARIAAIATQLENLASRLEGRAPSA